MDTYEQTFRAYLLRFAAVMVVTLALVAVFNWWVDPYRLFHSGQRPAAVNTKTRPAGNIADIKRLNAVSYQPTALILGNSRAEIGFDPAHEVWGALNHRAYNLAVPAQLIPAARDSFKAMLANHTPGTVVLGIDFQDFVQNAGRVNPRREGPEDSLDLDEVRLAEEAKALFTLTGIGDSIGTIRASGQAFPETMQADGFNPLLEWISIARREGYPSLFQQRLNEAALNYVRARKGLFPDGQDDSVEFAALRDILALARERGIHVYVVSYPYHAQYYLLFDELGLWPEFERWKKLVLQTVNDANTKGSGPPIEFWDFSAITSISTLPLPDSGGGGASTWYWEGGHFKKELGDIIAPQFLRPDDRIPADRRLGTRLTSESIAEWLAVQRDLLRKTAEADPEMVKSVQSAISKANGAIVSKSGN